MESSIKVYFHCVTRALVPFIPIKSFIVCCKIYKQQNLKGCEINKSPLMKIGLIDNGSLKRTLSKLWRKIGLITVSLIMSLLYLSDCSTLRSKAVVGLGSRTICLLKALKRFCNQRCHCPSFRMSKLDLWTFGCCKTVQ